MRGGPTGELKTQPSGASKLNREREREGERCAISGATKKEGGTVGDLHGPFW
ncbi:hypothetical protein ZHAS_00008349 [Anopheles sinensis]|uniref:Uncharacterized protein n=1 Tax=Anopheles sinensis TaxID=74873 RepID=A0A084VS82_ANOSI|nr:hypothetical protein ZHAS_00008349 [Anopheles sinensis]